MQSLMRASRQSARAPLLPAAPNHAYRAIFTSSSDGSGSLGARPMGRRGAIVPGSAAASDAAAFAVVRANSFSTAYNGSTIPGRLSDADHAKEAVVRQRQRNFTLISQRTKTTTMLSSCAFCGGRLS